MREILSLTILLVVSLFMLSCQKDDIEVHYQTVQDFYIYDVQTETLSRITDDRTMGNYHAIFVKNGSSIVSLGVGSGAQVIYKHQGLTGFKNAVAVGKVSSPHFESRVERKILADSLGETIYYCADYYDRNDAYLFPYSKDIYRVSLLTGTLNNLTRNTTTLVGSITLSDDEKRLLYNEIDTSTNTSRIIVFDLANKSRKVIRSSDTTRFHAPQFVHNSNKIVCLERKKITATANVVMLSETDSILHIIVGVASVGGLNNFPRISRNNLYPNTGYEIVNLETFQRVDVGTFSFRNECFISGDGSKAFISSVPGSALPGITIFNLATSVSITKEFSNSEERSLHFNLTDVSAAGDKVLIVRDRKIPWN